MHTFIRRPKVAMPVRGPETPNPNSLYPAGGETKKTGLQGFDLTEKDLPDPIREKIHGHLADMGIDRNKAKSNLREMLDNAKPEHHTAGARWYQDAHDEGNAEAKNLGIHPDLYHGVTAMLSPATEWEHNKKVANTLLKNGDYDPKRYQGYPAQLQKAKDLIATANTQNPVEDIDKQLGGNKVRSFFNNMSDPTGNGNDVTIDTHMLRALANGFNEDEGTGRRLAHVKDHATAIGSSPKFQGASLGLHPLAADLTREVTSEYNKKNGTKYTPAQVQAIIWSHQKDLFPRDRLNGLIGKYRQSAGGGPSANPGTIDPSETDDEGF